MPQTGRLGVFVRSESITVQAELMRYERYITWVKFLRQGEAFRRLEMSLHHEKTDLAAWRAQRGSDLNQTFGWAEKLFSFTMIKQRRLVESLLFACGENAHSGHG